MVQIHNKSPKDRLLLKCVRASSGCLEWTGSRFINRGKPTYGQMWYKGTNTKAHRVSWIEHFGKIPKGEQVLHKCDNPVCVEPDHLFLGTNLDNVRDCVAKGRKAKFVGEHNGTSKLNRDQVLSIRKDCRSGHVIAKELGVSPRVVYYIKKLTKWKHVMDTGPEQ